MLLQRRYKEGMKEIETGDFADFIIVCSLLIALSYLKGAPMKNDEWKLTKELERLRKFGFLLQARRCSEMDPCNYKYDIVFANSQTVLEPYCSLEEVMGIINSLETCLNMIIAYNEKKRKITV